MVNRSNVFLIFALLILAGMANAVSAQDCPINQVENVNEKLIDKAGRSPVYLMLNCEKALELSLKELSSRREAKDTFNKGRILLQIGEIYFEQKKWQESFDYYNQALPLYRQMKITDGESNALYNLAFVSRYLKNYSQSVKYFEELFPIAQANDAHGWSGSVLGYIADTYFESGDDVKAFEYLNKRLAHERKQNNVVGEYNAFKAIGGAYEAKGKKADALESYRTALEIYLKFTYGWKGEMVTAQIKELRDAIEKLQK